MNRSKRNIKREIINLVQMCSIFITIGLMLAITSVAIVWAYTQALKLAWEPILVGTCVYIVTFTVLSVIVIYKQP